MNFTNSRPDLIDLVPCAICGTFDYLEFMTKIEHQILCEKCRSEEISKNNKKDDEEEKNV